MESRGCCSGRPPMAPLRSKCCAAMGVFIGPLKVNKCPDDLAKNVFRMLYSLGVKSCDIVQITVSTIEGYARVLVRPKECEDFLVSIFKDVTNIMDQYDLRKLTRDPMKLNVTRISEQEEVKPKKSAKVAKSCHNRENCSLPRLGIPCSCTRYKSSLKRSRTSVDSCCDDQCEQDETCSSTDEEKNTTFSYTPCEFEGLENEDECEGEDDEEEEDESYSSLNGQDIVDAATSTSDLPRARKSHRRGKSDQSFYPPVFLDRESNTIDPGQLGQESDEEDVQQYKRGSNERDTYRAERGPSIKEKSRSKYDSSDRGATRSRYNSRVKDAPGSLPDSSIRKRWSERKDGSVESLQEALTPTRYSKGFHNEQRKSKRKRNSQECQDSNKSADSNAGDSLCAEETEPAVPRTVPRTVPHSSYQHRTSAQVAHTSNQGQQQTRTEPVLMLHRKTSTPVVESCGCPETIFYHPNQQIGTETRHAEFKRGGVVWDQRAFRFLVGKYVCGFLNSEGGTIYFGVTDDGKVLGIRVDARMEQELKADIDYATRSLLTPPLHADAYSVNFARVAEEGNQRAGGSSRQRQKLKVLEVCVKPLDTPGRRNRYRCNGVVYMRRDGSIQALDRIQRERSR